MGYPTTTRDLNYAKRRKVLIEHAIPANGLGVAEFVRAMVERFPNFEWWRLVDGKVQGLPIMGG